ncbi:alpha/beta fold hydrolase [Alcanivorax sp.]|uniref:alpha/beta fold hydrolase n=1 Tax=Alcanivorax sp. TaxID=1872427 RepID=UPI0026225434|nr:alpha/beta fold hydrolase [Alcanivorax sp.]
MLLSVFQALMAGYSRLLPGRASDTALHLLTTPRVTRGPLSFRGSEPDLTVSLGDRAQLAIWQGGEEAALFVHGWSGRATQMSPFINAVDAHRYTRYALILPGHGPQADGPAHVGDFIASIRLALDFIGGPVSVALGHSMGAGALAHVAAQDPRLERLVLIAGPAEFRGLVNNFAAFLHLGERARLQLLQKMAARVGIGFDALNIARLGGKIRGPVLLIHDTGDREIPFVEGLRLQQAIPGATLYQTQGLGHRRVLRDTVVIDTVTAFANPPTVSQAPVKALA